MTSARKMIRRGEVLSSIGEPLNTTFNVTGGETLFVQKRSAPGLYPRGDAPFELEVLHEDDDLAVVVKPPGVLTHKNKGEGQRHTVKTCLAYTLKPTASLQDALHRPVAAHRLDGPTGGLLVAAKTRTAAVELSRQFAEREVKKTYTAIVAGKLEGEGIVEIPLRGLEAVTRFRALRHCRSLKYEHCTLVALSPETGRTHQLRRHMLGLAHPIIGDRRYTGLSIEKPHWTPEECGLMLWASSLSFSHPRSATPQTFSSEPPPRFEKFMAREQERWERLGSGGKEEEEKEEEIKEEESGKM